MTENEKAELAYKDYFEKNKNNKLFFNRKNVFLAGFFAGQRSLFEGSVGKTIIEQHEQIEKMKCCDNCAHYKFEIEDFYCFCKKDTGKHCDSKLSMWKLKEE